MDAIVLVDKPTGLTSAEVVRRVKALVKPARVGHLGTLDPFATGLLPIMIGEATKLAPFIEGGDKRYEGAIALGAETDTLDREGEVTRTAALSGSRSAASYATRKRRRISIASSMLLSPGASRSQSSWPKYE